ncbi:MAG: Dehydrogenases (flavoprotein) [uncultured archaeon A07HB70]|nr:MAG: Dehydrogenases (flavoprotein) [uncultured archaeon A07HB70]
MERTDVAVVGGGPAGAAAGHAAAEAGGDALVVEKGVPRADREEPGPDSTDAAGILDYWVDIMDIHPDEFPDDVVLHELDRAEFVGPRESVTLDATGMESSYDSFGFCMQRARFDDFLRERAERAGAGYRVGTPVADVRLDDPDAPRRHAVELADGTEVTADSLVLADGPQRTVTNRVLDRLLSFDVTERLGTREANHIAYQEHRRLPPAVAEDVRGAIRFWWGFLPGHTAYPWVFPNDDGVARIGLTMPVDLDLAAVDRRERYPLLREDDETVPSGSEYLRRLLEHEYGDEYDIETDFPLVEDRGKRGGTETYPISSTQPVESPVGAGVAVAGGAMGTTSAFHEGGDHVAVRTGAIAGRLAAEGRLTDYNEAWQTAVGEEVRRNVALAEMCRSYDPSDWDHVFRTGRELLARDGAWGMFGVLNAAGTGLDALRMVGGYKRRKFGLRDGEYCQIHETDYRYRT